MNYLLIDTSSRTAVIALADDGGIIKKREWEQKGGLSQSLLPEIEKLISKNDFKSSDIKKIGVYLGPGSYTGLRIGVSTANAFAYSLNIPIVGIKGESFGKEKFQTSDLKPVDLNILHKQIKKNNDTDFKGSLAPFYGKQPNVG